MKDKNKSHQSLYDKIWEDVEIEPGSLLNTDSTRRNPERTILGEVSCATYVLGEEDRKFWCELAEVIR